jgi:hypothetical protein
VNTPESVYELLSLVKSGVEWRSELPDRLLNALDIAIARELVGNQVLIERYAEGRGTGRSDLLLSLTDQGRAELALRIEADGGPPATKAKASGNAVEALLRDEDSQAILNVTRSDKSADTKMREICGIDKRYLAWQSPQWSGLLGVDSAAIRKTKFWKEDRKLAIEADQALRREDECREDYHRDDD